MCAPLLCCPPIHPPAQLVHIAISPHNAAFYKLLDELWAEAEDLMDRGISGSGQGFDAPSAGRLGSHAFIPIHNPPEHRMADAIRKVGTCFQLAAQRSAAGGSMLAVLTVLTAHPALSLPRCSNLPHHLATQAVTLCAAAPAGTCAVRVLLCCV